MNSFLRGNKVLVVEKQLLGCYRNKHSVEISPKNNPPIQFKTKLKLITKSKRKIRSIRSAQCQKTLFHTCFRLRCRALSPLSIFIRLTITSCTSRPWANHHNNTDIIHVNNYISLTNLWLSKKENKILLLFHHFPW